MIITGMENFQNVCKRKLSEWYNKQEGVEKITPDNVFAVWSCKTLQNCKLLAATTVLGDGIYAEYTYNGDKQELYEDVYKKVQNTCHKGGIRKMKAMLSQPMAGKTDEEIKTTREKAIKVLKEKGYEIVNTLFTDEWYSTEKMKERGVVQIPLCFLAKSLENMSLCHAAYFCKGWENARGCRIEHDAAVAYELDVIYEE